MAGEAKRRQRLRRLRLAVRHSTAAGSILLAFDVLAGSIISAAVSPRLIRLAIGARTADAPTPVPSCPTSTGRNVMHYSALVQLSNTKSEQNLFALFPPALYVFVVFKICVQQLNREVIAGRWTEGRILWLVFFAYLALC
jgi:hypothetical protein